MRRFSGRTLDRLAGRIGADLVYLDGVGRGWNDARRLRVSKAQRTEVDDVGFVRAVVERFGRPAIGIGYSNGGQLLHRLLREAPGLLVGAVTIAAGVPVDEDFALAGVEPDAVPVLLLAGTADPIMPFDGGPTRMLGRTRGTVRSARESAETYGGSAAPSASRTGSVERIDRGTTRLVVQHGAGHVIPNRSTSPAKAFVGPSLHDLDTGEEIEAFFRLGRAGGRSPAPRP
ncbi:hypothetical protein [Amnibacterium kyonggiense]